MNALLKKHGNRPIALEQDGWTVFVSVRDSEYFRMLKSWRRKLRDCHPDKKGGSGERFRKAMQGFRRWRLEEARWYAKLNPPLLPPDGWRGAEQLACRNKKLRRLESRDGEVL